MWFNKQTLFPVQKKEQSPIIQKAEELSQQSYTMSEEEKAKKVQEIIPEILSKFKIRKEPHSLVALQGILDSMGFPHLFDSVLDELTKNYGRKFNRISKDPSRRRDPRRRGR